MARRRWKTIAAMFLIAMAISSFLTFRQTPIYESKARIFVSTDVSSSAEAFAASSFAVQRVQSYADLANSHELMQKVIDRLGLQMTPSELADRVSATVVQNTVIVEVRVIDPSPRVAQQIAQAEVEQLTGYLGELETPNGKTQTPVKATVVDQASYNPKQIAPRTGTNLLAGAVIGLLLGIAIAAAREILDNTIKSQTEVETAAEAPVMSTVGFDPNVEKFPLISDRNSGAMRSEAFRLLRTNLQFADLDKAPRMLVVTSAVPSEGKTTTSANLAIAMSQAGRRVLLVDGDLRRPRVAALLGLERAVGLTTVLVGRSSLEDSIQKHKASGVNLLSSGPIPPNPTEILQSKATKDLFEHLRESYDVVIIDAPPLLPVADAAIMASDADGAILVVRHGKTTKEQVHQAKARLDAVGARLFGAVVNMTPRRRIGRGYGSSYGYGYYEYAYEEDAKATGRRTGARRA